MGQRSSGTPGQQRLPFVGSLYEPAPEVAPPPLPEAPEPSCGPVRLEATVRKTRFSCAETGFAVLSMRGDAMREFTAVGPLAGFRVGQDLQMLGRWVTSPRFGLQFKVHDVEAVEISSLEGIQAHLEDCPVNGVGPRLAAALVRQFGLETWQILASQPERLEEVPGLRPTVAQALHEYARDHRALAQLASLLRKGGVGPATARRVYDFYRARGADPVEIAQNDPYQVARDVDRIGFEKADRIAEAAGVPKDAPSRIRAGLRHVLARAAEQSGHCFLPMEALVKEAGRLLALPSERVAPELAALVDDPLELLQPDRICAENGAAYLAPLLAAETAIAERVHAVLAHPPAVPADVVADAIARAERESATDGTPFIYNAEQRDAIEQLARANLVIVTGGPGTGKTTLVKGLVAVLDALGMKVQLAAPTGRASQRLRESTGRYASTVHRLLGYGHDDQTTRQTLRGALIVDEFSMMDAWLSSHLFNAIDPTSPIVLVGDVDQLPPVGPGAVLRHLIDSGVVPTVRLQVPIRQAEGSLLVRNAHAVNRGEEPSFPDSDPECTWLPIEPDRMEAGEAARLVVEQALSLVGEHGLFEAQVLAPMKRGPLGVDALNTALQAFLAPSGGPELKLPGRTFRVGDKVIQTRNDHDRGVMNGEIGRVLAIDPTRQTLTVDFRHRENGCEPVLYGTEDLEHLRLAYAVTIHKSQGSEYEAALMVLHDSHMFMLQRNLIYTALTRARKRVVVAGTKRALARAVKNASVAERHSRLMQRLRG